jgi:hypothetical protein
MEKIQLSENCVLYTENLILTPFRVLTSEIRRNFVSENPSLNTMLKLSKITNNRIPEQINTVKYIKSFNQLAQDANNLKESSKL